VTIGKGRSQADIHLQTAHDLASQLTDAEWLMSMPGTQEQEKELIL